jgi:acyl-CoA synthetase (AMP-forming)/AMP-acid ligase II
LWNIVGVMIYTSTAADVVVPDTTLHELALTALDKRGTATAFIDAATGSSTTGAEAVTSIRRIASELHRRGIGRGDVVCVAAPNMVTWPLVFFGALAAGATVATANPMLPAATMADQLKLTRTAMVLTVRPFVDWAHEAAVGTEARVVTFDELIDAATTNPIVDDGKRDATRAADVACLLSSSGTTGRPKAVVLSHHNLVAASVVALDTLEDLIVADGDATFIGVLPYFHVAGLLSSLVAPVLRGSPVVIQSRFDLEEFCRTVQTHRVTFASVVPPIALGLARHPVVDRYDLSSLRLLLVGAAPMGAELETACAQRLGCRVNQAYGMTEAAPITMSRPDRASYRPGTVGPVIANTEARVVDPDSGEDVPAGESGELWVRGPQVMVGYLDDPASTAATVTADGWLRTGDLCTIDDAGVVTVADRLKELIKVNAMQVAPAELEDLLLTHPAIADCAVVPRPHEQTGEVPVAYVVARGPIEPGVVKAYVAGSVAAYKRLADVVIVEEIPKSPTGKVLRRELVARERARTAASTVAVS